MKKFATAFALFGLALAPVIASPTLSLACDEGCKCAGKKDGCEHKEGKCDKNCAHGKGKGHDGAKHGTDKAPEAAAPKTSH